VPEITVRSERRTHVVDVTAQVRDALGDLEGAAAILLYVPHTTAGIVIQEHAGSDPAVGTDLEMALERIVQDGWPWEHYEEGNVNPWAHARTALTASSVTIPVVDGSLALGTYQGVFLCEFDGPKTRRILITHLG
jgi:secondary thiamine-phosphate synthase enzyme